MVGRTLIEMQNPVTQSIDAVKSLLTWRGRGTDPMPATVEFVQEGEGCMVLVLSNKKDSYYVVTPAKCSCPAATYHPGQPCKHQRRFFPQEQVAIVAESGSIRPECKWPGGLNGPVDKIPGEA